ncbi:MAG: ATP-dependent DNA helicase RecG [Acidimicrobiales bacterium]
MARSLVSLDRIGVERLNGVGPAKLKALDALGIRTVLDLLTHYPRRYVDRTAQAAIGQMALGEEATVLASVRRVSSRRTRQGRALVELDVFDGTGYLGVTFFNQPWRAKQLAMGRQALFFGRLEAFRGRRRMTNPVVDLVEGDPDPDGSSRTGRVVAVYPQSEKSDLNSWELGAWAREALERAGELADPVPRSHLRELGLLDRTTAMRQIHVPDNLERKDEARRRLAFDELLRLQVEVVGRKRAAEREARGIRHDVGGGGGGGLVGTAGEAMLGKFRENLPFTLTQAQEAALAEILGDLGGPHPMHRLLQGEVGSGKTVVAVAALLVAVAGGHQGALMAPTEVLADQHYVGVRDLVSGLIVPDPDTLGGERPVRVELVSGRNTASGRARLAAELAAGRIDIAIGTHALLTGSVAFASLGVVVIDEQHRFGVEQRDQLRAKGRDRGGADPDVLVMTATPIPRTAAMTVFGDLDVSVMAQRPPGRLPVTTRWARGPMEVAAAWAQVRGEVAAGHKAYVVCPLVEGSERIEAASAVEQAERLGREELAGLRLGLLHGQLPAKDKESVMGDFRAGRLDVLVATTVIEVGVDVADATVMVVEDAARFGMAQLHQLRGRVGRGGDASWCHLLGDASTPEAAERLAALEAHDDGFELAEIDLDLRGEGTILGARQQGRSDLKLASLRDDRELVGQAREVAFAMVDGEGGLSEHPVLVEEVAFLLGAEEAGYLLKS